MTLKRFDFSDPVARKALHDRFAAAVGPLFLQGEQELQGTVPISSHPGILAGRINPKWGLLATVPEEYRPHTASVFPSYVFKLPPQAAIVTASAAAALSRDHLAVYDPDGNVRIFVHPTDKEYARSILETEPEEWPTTPTSSVRTVLTMNPADGAIYMVKESMHAKTAALGGFVPKVNHPHTVAKAVAMADVLRSAHDHTGGLLQQSGKTWDVMAEDLGVSLAGEPGKKFGGNIMRSIDELKKGDVLTWYALFAHRAGKPSIIEEMYQKSGYSSRLDFAWHEFVKPLIELEGILNWQEDIATQMHQQNTMVRIDHNSGRTTGIVFRDGEGMSIGNTLRTRVLGRPAVRLPGEPFSMSAKTFGFARSVDNIFFGYKQKLRRESILWAFTAFVGPFSVHLLSRRADRLMLESFNQTYPKAQARSLGQAKRILQNLTDLHETPAEKEIYAPLRDQSLVRKVWEHWKRLRSMSAAKFLPPNTNL